MSDQSTPPTPPIQLTAFDPVAPLLTAKLLGSGLQPREGDSPLNRAARLARAFGGGDDYEFAYRRPLTDDDTND